MLAAGCREMGPNGDKSRARCRFTSGPYSKRDRHTGGLAADCQPCGRYGIAGDWQHHAGLGFALGADGTGNHWQGIDLDGVDSNPALQLLADELPGYTETSPSGNGYHAIGYGKPFSGSGQQLNRH